MKKIASLAIQMRPAKILICANTQADLNLRWAHMSEGTFFDVAAHVILMVVILNNLNKCSIIFVELFRIAKQTTKAEKKNTALRKHAFSPPKNENFQIKNSDIFHISAQNIDCGYSLEPPRRGGSNEYPQSMFLSRNKKNNVYPCKPQFYYIKVGFKGVKII